MILTAAALPEQSGADIPEQSEAYFPDQSGARSPELGEAGAGQAATRNLTQYIRFGRPVRPDLPKTVDRARTSAVTYCLLAETSGWVDRTLTNYLGYAPSQSEPRHTLSPHRFVSP
jgi:hypothetical protein